MPQPRPVPSDTTIEEGIPSNAPAQAGEVGGWNGPAGYKRLIDLAAPMLVSMGAYTFMLFCDRVFLSWRSAADLAAVVPATAVLMTVSCVFFGTVVYSGTFVAQYFGAGRPERIGACLWAGVTVAVIGQAVVGCVALFATELFALFGHPPHVQALEVAFFQIAVTGVGAQMVSVALAAVYSGRGITRPTMWVNGASALLNIPLNYVLIFGEWGFPELGMRGAAISTVMSQWFGLFAWAAIVLRRENEERFRLYSSFGIPSEMLRRLLRFGFPNGLHFFLDAVAWTGFSLLVGQLGVVPLAGSNIAWQINSLALLPMIGIGMATGILVGQFQGARRPDHAAVAVHSGLVLGMTYMTLLAALLLVAPGVVIWPFTLGEIEDFAEVERLSTHLLRYVVILGFAQGVQMIYGFALKAAGDVRFIISVLAGTASVGFILPIWWMVQRGYPLERLWIWFALQASCVAYVLRRRFLSGAWRSIRVIEVDPICAQANLNDSPRVDAA